MQEWSAGTSFGRVLCHATASGGWLLLTREAIVGPGPAAGGSRERIMRSRMVVL
jgi:hypothetical protein